MIFSTRAEALNFLKGIYDFMSKDGKTFFNKGVYFLRYGEYDRPDYVVRKFRGKEEYGIKKITYYYPNTYTRDVTRFLNDEELWEISH